MKKIILVILALFIINTVNAQEGELIQKDIEAPSLANSVLGVPTQQPVAVYLPPSYNSSDKSYPVLYFLPGYATTVNYLTKYGAFQGFRLKEDMDKLIAEGKIKEMIVVIPNGLGFLLGAFYTNSPVTGNWEDFIVKDVVKYVDENYRTIKESASRGIAGHSMGGYGALNLAMLHPDIFGSTYGLCPGLFDENGLKNDKELTSKEVKERYFEMLNEYKNLSKEEAKTRFMAAMSHSVLSKNDFLSVFFYAYGATFSPKPDAKAPFLEYLFISEAEEYKVNEQAWKNYENGFGNLKNKINKYKSNLQKLKMITIDYAISDGHQWIPEGSIYFSEQLNAAGIKNTLLKHDGEHSSQLGNRMRDFILPSFSEVFYIK